MLSADEQAMLAKPVADLNLSVRERKCMIRLGINTVGDLVHRTGDDLLECEKLRRRRLEQDSAKSWALFHGLPRALHVLPSHLAIPFAITPPAMRKLPPA